MLLMPKATSYINNFIENIDGENFNRILEILNKYRKEKNKTM